LTAGHTETLEELFDQIHKELASLGRIYAECAGMGATLTMCWFTPDWMHFAHIGDSRLYYLPAREGTLKQLSHDDTHVGWLFRTGKIKEWEARAHPRRNVLQRALGGGNQFVDPQVGSVGYEAGDIFLLCSDGVIDGLFDEQLAEFLRIPHAEGNPAGRLVQEAIQRSGRDNTTALVIYAE
jgi:PPM family protein phosphatase